MRGGTASMRTSSHKQIDCDTSWPRAWQGQSAVVYGRMMRPYRLGSGGKVSAEGKDSEMSFTLLHLAGALPLRRDLDMKAYVAINIAIDVEVGLSMLLDLDHLHMASHSLLGALLLSFVLWLVTRWSLPSILFGALSHIFIDALYHSDVSLGVFSMDGIVPPIAIDLFLLALPVAFWRQWLPLTEFKRRNVIKVLGAAAVVSAAMIPFNLYYIALHQYCLDFPTTCSREGLTM